EEKVSASAFTHPRKTQENRKDGLALAGARLARSHISRPPRLFETSLKPCRSKRFCWTRGRPTRKVSQECCCVALSIEIALSHVERESSFDLCGFVKMHPFNYLIIGTFHRPVDEEAQRARREFANNRLHLLIAWFAHT
ncbi:hypothetical protein M9458_054231, partial [Cirrhinus mrigala]